MKLMGMNKTDLIMALRGKSIGVIEAINAQQNFSFTQPVKEHAPFTSGVLNFSFNINDMKGNFLHSGRLETHFTDTLYDDEVRPCQYGQCQWPMYGYPVLPETLEANLYLGRTRSYFCGFVLDKYTDKHTELANEMTKNLISMVKKASEDCQGWR